MRREFSSWAAQFGQSERRFVFLTGDLGYAALENVQAALGDRFVNMGVSEQNMISVAAGLAQQGLRPLCYSIAPFAVFRPYEQIRLDVALHGLPVKIVGNGGGYGYGIMGATHHALEDLAVLSVLPNFSCVVPLCNSDVAGGCEALFAHDGPGYLRLGYGIWPTEAPPLPAFAPVRQIAAATGGSPKLTVVGLGPVLLNILPTIAAQPSMDVFAVSQLPVPAAGVQPIAQSLAASHQLLVIEEHRERGGLAENLVVTLARDGVAFRLCHHHAAGYPDGRYGSQSFHQQQSQLDAAALARAVAKLTS